MFLFEYSLWADRSVECYLCGQETDGGRRARAMKGIRIFYFLFLDENEKRVPPHPSVILLTDKKRYQYG